MFESRIYYCLQQALAGGAYAKRKINSKKRRRVQSNQSKNGQTTSNPNKKASSSCIVIPSTNRGLRE
jgi:hypothetical protein